jgi:pimeloyl-ACP methyl ester carboxylesterase
MPIRSIKYKDNSFSISYEMFKNDISSLGSSTITSNSDTQSKQYITILHGWGSNKKLMQTALQDDLSTQLPEYTQLYIDMPGFGNSSNDAVLRTDDYKNIIELFLDSLSVSKDIIIGHSFGGKVATLLKPSYLILLSSAGIVEQKPLKIKLKIAIAKLFNSIGIGKFSSIFRSKDVDSMPQNMYETFKNVVDEDFSDIFASYDGKTSIFWGAYDKSTSLQSGQTIHKLIKNSSFKSYDNSDDDHYFFMKNSLEIVKGTSKRD